MKERTDITEIDFTDQIKEAKEKTVESEASQEEQCNNEDCGDCGCGEAKEESEAELSKEQKKLPPALQEKIMKKKGNKKENGDKKEDAKADHYDELEGYDMKCPTCGCALGKMYMKGGMMRPVSMYASKYSDLYEKVKAADPQRDPDKHKVDIKTKNDSTRKSEDLPTSEELREVDEPIK